MRVSMKGEIMTNCKEEFLNETKDLEILCAEIEREVSTKLQVNFLNSELEEFLKLIDFDYNAGFGCQQVYGTIWYKDGTWSERSEYDGSEWWEHRKAPKIPKGLRG